MMLDKAKELLEETSKFYSTQADEIEAFRIKLLGNKGELKKLFAAFKEVAPEDKKEFGQLLNTLKQKAQGKFDQVSYYDADPSKRLARFVAAGAGMVHVVDLDGARAGAPQQHELIGALAKGAATDVQAAGGIRSAAHVQTLLASGISKNMPYIKN